MAVIRAAVIAASITALSVSTVPAVEGYVVLTNTWWVSESLPEGSWMVSMETGDTTRISNSFWRTGAISPDGREVAGYMWTGYDLLNNDGTNERRLFDVDHDTYMNQGWLNRTAFTDQGIWWLSTDEDFTFKRLMFADRYTGDVTMAADLSAYGDAVQGVCMTNDGLKGAAWLHDETVTISFTSHLQNPTLRSMTDIWGHGPIMPVSGDVVVISAMSSDKDLGAGNPDHRTWVVYDWATGVLGSFLDRYVSAAPEKTGIGKQWVVRNHGDYIVFQTEDGTRYMLNWRTHETVELPIPAGGSVCEAWLGPLPAPHADAPAVGIDHTSLEFTSVSGDPAPQTVTVTNLGTGTLDNVTVDIQPGSASDWLTVTPGGAGNAQSLANTVSASSLSSGSHTATVAVNAVNSAISASYTVTFTLGTQVAAASNLRVLVDYNGSDVRLAWNDNADNESGFIVERSDNGGAFAEVARTAADAQTYTDAGLGAGTYDYRIRAYDSNGSAAPTNTVSETLTGNPRFALTNPARGDTLWAGQEFTIRWSAEIFTLAEVLITFDDGEEWTPISVMGGIGASDPEWGAFTFTVPDQPSNMAGVMVRQYTDHTVALSVTGCVVAGASGATSHQIAPNPAGEFRIARRSDGLVITGLSGTLVEIDVLDLQGRMVASYSGRCRGRTVLPAAAVGALLLQLRTEADGVVRYLKVSGAREPLAH